MCNERTAVRKWELVMNWSGYKSVHTHRLLHLTNTFYFTAQVLFALVVQMRALVRLWCQTHVEDWPPLHSLIPPQLPLPHCCRDALKFPQSLAGQGKLPPKLPSSPTAAPHPWEVLALLFITLWRPHHSLDYFYSETVPVVSGSSIPAGCLEQS